MDFRINVFDNSFKNTLKKDKNEIEKSSDGEINDGEMIN